MLSLRNNAAYSPEDKTKEEEDNDTSFTSKREVVPPLKSAVSENKAIQEENETSIESKEDLLLSITNTSACSGEDKSKPEDNNTSFTSKRDVVSSLKSVVNDNKAVQEENKTNFESEDDLLSSITYTVVSISR